MPTATITIFTPQEFCKQLLDCKSKLEVSKACNDLIQAMQEKGNAASTIRKNLTKYRKEVQSLHKNYEIEKSLLTPQTFTNLAKESVTENQHCALEFLKLPDELKSTIAQQSKDKVLHRAGESYDTDDIATPHTIDVSEVFKVAEKLLNSTKPQEIALALETFTGRRRAENFLATFIADDVFTLIFNGQLKKRTTE